MVADSAMDRRKRKNDRPTIQPSDKVRKCLFGKATKDEKDEELKTVEQENLSNLQEMKVKYGYDFYEDKRSEHENTQYTVVKVTEVSYENDVNEDKPSAPDGRDKERTTDPTTTPNRKCLNETHSDSKLSNINSVNSTLNKTDPNGERSSSCEPDKALVAPNGQSYTPKQS